MKKFYAITVSVLFWSNEMKFSVDRMFLLPKKYRFYSTKSLFAELRRFINGENIYVLAVKYGTVNLTTPIFLKDFKEIRDVEIVDDSDWFIEPMFDKLKLETIDRRADPMILMVGDTKRLQHRISCYVDLINRGYSKEEALSYIY